MALISCRECQREILDSTLTCPYCGAYTLQDHQQPIKVHTASLVLAIIGLVFAIVFPLVAYPCSIVGLVKAVNNRTTHRTTAAFVLCIIGLTVALINSIAGAFLYMRDII